jgi:hypothetical protein
MPTEKQIKYWKSKEGIKQSQETINKRNKKLKKVVHTEDWNKKVSDSKIREKNPMWNGGIYKTTHGYLMIKFSEHPFADRQGYIQEHRLKVEVKIGRYLTKEEKIHHINGIKTDNRIENLMLFPNDSKHHKFHQKIKQFGFTTPIKRQIDERWKEYQINPLFS